MAIGMVVLFTEVAAEFALADEFTLFTVRVLDEGEGANEPPDSALTLFEGSF